MTAANSGGREDPGGAEPSSPSSGPRRVDLHEYLNWLSPAQQGDYRAVMIDGQSTSDRADERGVCRESVYTNISNAIARLREIAEEKRSERPGPVFGDGTGIEATVCNRVRNAVISLSGLELRECIECGEPVVLDPATLRSIKQDAYPEDTVCLVCAEEKAASGGEQA